MISLYESLFELCADKVQKAEVFILFNILYDFLFFVEGKDTVVFKEHKDKVSKKTLAWDLTNFYLPHTRHFPSSPKNTDFSPGISLISQYIIKSFYFQKIRLVNVAMACSQQQIATAVGQNLHTCDFLHSDLLLGKNLDILL